MKHLKTLLIVMVLCSTGFSCGKKTIDYQVVECPTFAKDLKADSKAYLLDVRTPQEFASGHIESAHNLDWLNPVAFKAGAELLPKDSTIYVYCRSGHRSAEAAEYLAKMGYKVVDLDGGYMAWQKFTLTKGQRY